MSTLLFCLTYFIVSENLVLLPCLYLAPGPRTYHIPLSPLRAPTQVTWMTSGAQGIHKQLALSVANPPAAMLTVRGVHCFLAENVAGILAPSRGQVSRFGGFSPAALHANHL